MDETEVERIRWWFYHDLTPADRQGWLNAWEGRGITEALMNTLPEDRRPPKTGAWVTEFFVGSKDQPGATVHRPMSDELDHVLNEEYGKHLDE